MTNNNRVLVYSVTTDSFFSENESKIANELMDKRVEKKELSIILNEEKTVNWSLNKLLKKKIETHVLETGENEQEIIKELISDLDVEIKKLSGGLKSLLENNLGEKRILNRDSLFTDRKVKDKHGNETTKEVNKTNKVVALFESSFTRALELSKEEVNEEVIIVKAYHYEVLNDLINKGFTYLGEEYVFWSSSSGQMKNKKCVFVKKAALYKEHENKKGERYTVKDKLTCGLSWKRINETKIKDGYGINTNKYLAYLSLQNSNTTKWEGFDINKVVVCPDLEVSVKDKVEFIDRDTYKISEPEEKTLPMNVSDGVGLILPDLSKKNFQFRIGWGKGLLSPFDFRAAAKEMGNYWITDVWGETHHIINDDVQIILSASQLKCWKYYKSMKEYRELFDKFECEAGKCNEEVESKDIHLNYQFIQGLEMKRSELENIARATNYDIHNLGSNADVMLRSLGATTENEKKNSFQQSLLMYPNLLNDSHAKEMIKSRKKSMIRDAKAGTLRVEGKRMFVLPDLYAYCEFLFKGDNNPNGLLPKNKVFSKDIEEGYCDIMRSPMLYREHGTRKNIKNEKLTHWFKTGALYCSNKDYLARLLQMDFDGDQVNVCVNKQLVSVAKRNMRGIVPLYYEMSNAPVQKLSNETIYDSLTLAFGGSIGTISNDITRIWASAGGMNKEKIDTIKYLTMYNNFMIDHCKTSFLPKPVGEAKKLIKKYNQGDMPYFFQWAKGKEQVADKKVKEYIRFEKLGKKYKLLKSEYTPVINMLEDIIHDQRITFRTVAPKFDYRMLMDKREFESASPELDEMIIETYKNINKNKKWMIDKDSDEYKENKYLYVAKVIREEIMDAAKSVYEDVDVAYVIDALVYNLHSINPTGNKKTLWESFGSDILNNLERNLAEAKECVECSNKFRYVKNKKRCDDCQKKVDKEKAKLRKQKERRKKSA